MSDKYRGKYRRGLARLQNCDYGSDAAYFITICTKNREHYFGEKENVKMDLSAAGHITECRRKTIGQQGFQNHVKNTVSTIICSYKSTVTKYCNRLEWAMT